MPERLSKSTANDGSPAESADAGTSPVHGPHQPAVPPPCGDTKQAGAAFDATLPVKHAPDDTAPADAFLADLTGRSPVADRWDANTNEISFLGKGAFGTVKAFTLEEEAGKQLIESVTHLRERVAPTASVHADQAETAQTAVTQNIATLMNTTCVAAVKVLSKTEMSEEHLDRFVSSEVRQQFLHQKDIPAIPRLYGLRETEKTIELIMECVPGFTLDHLMLGNRSEAFHPRLASSIAAQLARDIYVAHKAKIVLRDIKPENAMISDTGLTKLLDLGTVKRDDVDATSRTIAGTFTGSPAYMAPELARGASFGEVGPFNDVFSAGVMFAELFTGEKPYGGSTTVIQALQSRATLVDPAVITIPRPDDDSWMHAYLCRVEQFVQRMLHPDHSVRPTSEEVAQFFHSNSEFANTNFYAFIGLEHYGIPKHRMLMKTKKPLLDYQKEYARSRFADAPEMLKAMTDGLETRRSSFDFLQQYDGAPVASESKPVTLLPTQTTLDYEPLDATHLRESHPPTITLPPESKRRIPGRLIGSAVLATVVLIAGILYLVRGDGTKEKLTGDLKTVKQPNDGPSQDGTPIVPFVPPNADLVTVEMPLHLSFITGEDGTRIDIAKMQILIDGKVLNFSQNELYRTYSAALEGGGQVNSFAFEVPDGGNGDLRHGFVYTTGEVIVLSSDDSVICMGSDGKIAYRGTIDTLPTAQLKEWVMECQKNGGTPLKSDSDVPELMQDQVDSSREKDLIRKTSASFIKFNSKIQSR